MKFIRIPSPQLLSKKILPVFALLAIAGTSSATLAGELISEVTVEGMATPLLADSFSRTLYVFDPDTGSGKSVCNAACAEAWPPLTMTAAEAAKLGDPRLTTVTRDSGLVQLQFNGKPVYTFNQDRTVGDIKGDGVGGVWHVIPVEAATAK